MPLLMYYEVSHPGAREVQVTYTVIFTNEDGGTPTAALMARWGRAADIEWVYEFHARDGQIFEESYQGVEHQTKPFSGKRTNGSHPLLAGASDNNNFSDSVVSPVRFALLPVAADLHNSSRESVMDAYPWIYRVMAEELLREDRIKETPTDINSIADPRNYLYVDIHAKQRGTSVSVAAKKTSEVKSFSSDLGEPRLRIDRSGYLRTAIRLDLSGTAVSISSLEIRCHPTQLPEETRACQEVEVSGVSVLDSNYKPLRLKVQDRSPATLKPDETKTVEVHSRRP